MLSALTYAKAIGNLWRICLGVNILRLEWFETLSENHVLLINLLIYFANTMQAYKYKYTNISYNFKQKYVCR